MTEARWRRVALPPDCLRSIRAAAEAAYPAECCGLLIGWGEADVVRVTRTAPSINLLATESLDRFEVDPALRFRLMRDLDGGPERIVGHYHSHPDAPAAPSARDVTMAYEPELIWLIVAVKAGQATEAATFLPRPTGGGFERLSM